MQTCQVGVPLQQSCPETCLLSDVTMTVTHTSGGAAKHVLFETLQSIEM